MGTDIALRFYDVYNRQDVGLLDELLAADYVGEVNGTKIVGAAAAKEFIGAFLAGFPDVQYTVHDVVAQADKVVARWTATATHQGSFAGIEPTGKDVTMLGITIFQVAEGKIRGLWNNWDLFGLLQQLRSS
ncbi:MAG: ester cyclase [Herpetosiphonaceae bacterium]|nr:ester cyclase [Herpetosiphonaceae bacterium]